MTVSAGSPPRLFVCDPTCINHYGHNLLSGKRLAFSLQHALGLQTFLCVSRLLPDASDCQSVSQGFSFLPFFRHYWPREMPAPAQYINRDPAIYDLMTCGYDEYLSLRENFARADLDELITSCRIESSDILFYPNMDYVSLRGLCRLVHERGIESIPRLLIRFIGVLEFPSDGDYLSLQPLICQLLQARSAGLRIAFSAESATLARELESLYGVHVFQSPTLSDASCSPLPQLNHANIFFPGSGRHDKGFFRIRHICRALDSLMSLPYTVYAQDMPVYRYSRLSLAATLPLESPEVVMLPSILSENRLSSLMQKSHIVVLPYDSSVYRRRSSAIMADAAHMGRFIVASAGCGFSEDICRFNLGLLARSDEDFAEKIACYLQSNLDSGAEGRLAISSRLFRDFSVQSIVEAVGSLLA